MVTRFQRWVILMASGILSLMGGCQGGDELELMPIRGQVSYNDQPLQSGMVVYLPKVPGAGRQASGPLDSQGRFVMTSRTKGDGVMYGQYNVVIYAYEESATTGSRQDQETGGTRQLPKSKIPARYSSPETSGLSDTVDARHSGEKRFELTD